MRSRKIEHKILEQDAAVPFVTRDSAAVGIGDDCVAEPHGDLPFRKRISDWQHPLPFKFVDLFAGIGGFRIALERLGGRCVFSCEWDQFAQQTYEKWFSDKPWGDIRLIHDPDRQIPDHDILAAGFPCQPFSIAGVSKKKSLGRAHGFKCAEQGNLFFVLAHIIKIKRPPVLFLENVKNLRSHDSGRTWRVIHQKLSDDLGYWVNHKVIDALGWVPQHRERIYIVCFDKCVFTQEPNFAFPEPPENQPTLASILEPDPDPKYTLSDHLWTYLKEYADRHRNRGNGFGYGLAHAGGHTRTLSARYYKDGSEILIPQEGKNPRRLTPKECQRLMGFPEDKEIVVSDTQAYRQFGNAVVPPVVEAVGRNIISVLADFIRNDQHATLIKRSSDKPNNSLRGVQRQVSSRI